MNRTPRADRASIRIRAAPRSAAMIAASCAGPRLHAPSPRATSRKGWSSIVSITLAPTATGFDSAAVNCPWRNRPSKLRLARPWSRVFDAGSSDRLAASHCPAAASAAQRPDAATIRGGGAAAAADAPIINSIATTLIAPTLGESSPHLYLALADDEAGGAPRAKAVVLHDAEDLVHPLELRLFDRLVERAALVQLSVLPLPDPASRWIGGHYADEFAESHVKELVVREAVGAAIPLAGVGCAIERGALDRLAAANDGRPFAAASLTEDYELGLRLGALGLRTMFVRIPATPGRRAVVASRGHFPADLDAAVRQKARWIGGIALAGWDRLGWSGGIGERWMRMRDRRGPLAALLLLAGYVALLLWLQIALPPRSARRSRSAPRLCSRLC